MRYELYIDVYFLINFIMDLILLRLASGILRQRTGAGRILAAGASGAAVSCAVVWFLALPTGRAHAHAAVRVLDGAAAVAGPAAAAMLSCAVAFRPSHVRELLRETLLLLFLAAVCGGLMEFLLEHTETGYYAVLAMRGDAAGGLPFLMWVMLVCGSVFLFRYLWMNASETRREKAALCPATLRIGERRLQVTAYRDSGNMLTEPESGRPVSIVAERVWTELVRAAAEQGRELKVRPVRYRTIGSPLGVMETTQIDSLELYLRTEAAGLSFRDPASAAAGTEKEDRPWIARAPFPLSREGGYEMLLHRDL